MAPEPASLPSRRVAGAFGSHNRIAPALGAIPYSEISLMSAVTVPHSPALSSEALQAHFLTLLPRILLHGRVAFRHLRCPHQKEEALGEMVALSWWWFVRLERRGKDAARFPSTLASFAARAVNSGRRLTGQEKAKDVLSPSAQRRHGFHVQSLPTSVGASHETLYAVPHGQQLHDACEERLRDNRRSPVPDQVAFRLDFPAWLGTVTERDRHLVEDLALGHRTLDLAGKYGLSPARISQKRREFHDGWASFCDDPVTDQGAPALV